MAPGTERVRGAYRVVKTLYSDIFYRSIDPTLHNLCKGRVAGKLNKEEGVGH